MKPINEVIADLVARGFMLPEGLHYLGQHNMWARGADYRRFPDQQAIDLIACEFARQARDGKSAEMAAHGLEAGTWLRTGDTEAALRALWEATG